ncbi:MAG: pectinesterase family protein [Nibricoccus sp.]
MRYAALFSCLCVLISVRLVAADVPPSSAPAKIRVALIGDSTVTDNAGWGLGFQQFLGDRIECLNLSKGGRSSMSFMKEGRWAEALKLKADYYVIQFGHNDEPGKPDRSTEIDEYRRYMNQYVDEARAIGATPVLVTSLVRRQFVKGDDHKIDSSLAPRVEIVRQIAKEKNVPLVELHDRSKELCEKIGREGCYAFSPQKEGGVYDGTHLDAKGSMLFARLVVEELRKAVPALAPDLLRDPKATSVAAQETKYDAVVSFDGSGTHTTVQAAIDAAPANGTKPFVILIKPGVYKEHVFVASDKPFIALRGEANELAATVITQATNVGTLDAKGRKISTRESATVLIQASNFSAENITFENTTTREERIQALAMYVEADRAVFKNCRFLGWQDTLRVDKGRQYLKNCYIEGHVDFIYASGTAVFDHCEIHCKADGYITAVSTPAESKFGFVFLDCRVTTAPEVEKGVYLARPWREYSATAFLRCELPAKIHPEGWYNWGKPEREKTVRYFEYKNTGPGAAPEKRVSWARQLTDDQAKEYTVEGILAGNDAWNPAR